MCHVSRLYAGVGGWMKVSYWNFFIHLISTPLMVIHRSCILNEDMIHTSSIIAFRTLQAWLWMNKRHTWHHDVLFFRYCYPSCVVSLPSSFSHRLWPTYQLHCGIAHLEEAMIDSSGKKIIRSHLSDCKWSRTDGNDWGCSNNFSPLIWSNTYIEILFLIMETIVKYKPYFL
jgi:hypothetical protein